MKLPNVFGKPAPVTPPVLKWRSGSTPADAADEYARASIISDASVRATAQGGGILDHAFNIAAEQGKQLDPERGIQ